MVWLWDPDTLITDNQTSLSFKTRRRQLRCSISSTYNVTILTLNPRCSVVEMKAARFARFPLHFNNLYIYTSSEVSKIWMLYFWIRIEVKYFGHEVKSLSLYSQCNTSTPQRVRDILHPDRFSVQ